MKSHIDHEKGSMETEMWDLAELFDVTEQFMRKAAWWYTYGNLAVEM